MFELIYKIIELIISWVQDTNKPMSIFNVVVTVSEEERIKLYHINEDKGIVEHVDIILFSEDVEDEEDDADLLYTTIKGADLTYVVHAYGEYHQRPLMTTPYIPNGEVKWEKKMIGLMVESPSVIVEEEKPKVYRAKTDKYTNEYVEELIKIIKEKKELVENNSYIIKEDEQYTIKLYNEGMLKDEILFKNYQTHLGNLENHMVEYAKTLKNNLDSHLLWKEGASFLSKIGYSREYIETILESYFEKYNMAFFKKFANEITLENIWNYEGLSQTEIERRDSLKHMIKEGIANENDAIILINRGVENYNLVKTWIDKYIKEDKPIEDFDFELMRFYLSELGYSYTYSKFSVDQIMDQLNRENV